MELLLVLGILGVFLGLALPLLSPNRLALDQAARSLATSPRPCAQAKERHPRRTMDAAEAER